jgi:hypothetical protein
MEPTKTIVPVPKKSQTREKTIEPEVEETPITSLLEPRFP